MPDYNIADSLLDLGLAQIYPVWDEDDGDERIAVSASFTDPYLLILRDDSSVLLLQPDKSGDLDELTCPETVTSQSWLCGCLYTDKHKVFEESNDEDNTYMFLLNSECKLFVSLHYSLRFRIRCDFANGPNQMFRLPNMELVSVTEGVDFLSSILSSDPPTKRLNSRETISELLVADMGELPWASPYLIVR